MKAIRKLTNLYKVALRLNYVPISLEVAEVIMITKPGKPPNISLLPVLRKFFEKIVLKRLKGIREEKVLIPTHQFGFCKQHSIIDHYFCYESKKENKRNILYKTKRILEEPILSKLKLQCHIFIRAVWPVCLVYYPLLNGMRHALEI